MTFFELNFEKKITKNVSRGPLVTHTRHLQLLAGMERDKYVVVHWILIAKIEAILKKKVPQTATGSF